MKINIRNIILLLGLILIISISSCEGPSGPAGINGTNGPSLTGNLIGYSFLYDVNGYRLADSSGITIKIEGTTDSLITGIDGKWEFSNLSTGTYTIDISKSGYGTRKIVGYQFIGGGDVYSGQTNLYQIPAFMLTNLSDSIANGLIYLKGTLSGILPINVRSIQFFVGLNSNVSSDPANYIYTINLGSSAVNFINVISAQNLYSGGFSSGQTVYIVAYSESYSAVSYIDLATGRSIYPNINPLPSNIISLVVP